MKRKNTLYLSKLMKNEQENEKQQIISFYTIKARALFFFFANAESDLM